MSNLDVSFDIRKAQKNIFGALLDARSKVGGKKIIIEDSDGRQLSYTEIVRASFALGSALTKGRMKEETMGIMLPTGAGSIISFFSLNAYGRIPAMLNFTAGSANIKAACKAANITNIITAHQFVEKANLKNLVDELKNELNFIYLEDVRESLTFMDKIKGGLGPFIPWLFRSQAHWDSPAVTLFTSGTEGSPKGVVLSHANLVSNVFQIIQHVEGMLTPKDIMYNPLPTFHCFGLTAGVMIGLLTGMKVVLHPSPLQVKEIPKRIADTKATILFATDTFLNQYARASGNEELSCLRYVVCGAESVKKETRDFVKKKFNVDILEGYGATEAAPVLAVNQPDFNRPGTVGRPLPGVVVEFEPVDGIVGAGRMKAKGPNVMLGYLSEDDPMVLKPIEDGWHDTGDVVSQDEDGALTIRGRIKRFAKIGGEMVSLAVVENCAQSVWPEHNHAAAVLPDPRKGEQIILLTTNDNADRMDLLHWFQNHGVSELSLPRKVFKVDEIPLLGSGKMDIGSVQKLAADRIKTA